jgi:hypothetical protein
MSRPTIKDIIAVAELTKYEKDGALQTRYPIGEALTGGETFERMTAYERAGMEERLFYTINNLIETAAATHLADCKLPDTDEVNQDFITRLSTNEFFFYTQEPLTLQEFEALQNNIARVVDTLPAGIHLILGSFAVKTADNKVMNVVPHISSGSPAAFQFIVKNHTAPIDVRYKETDGTTLAALDCSSESTELPSIIVGGIQQRFTFNNIISCPAPNGTKLNTIVDICLDHNKGVGNKYITEIEAGIRDEAISHIVTSNVTHLTTSHCWGPVTHVDPQHSSQKYELSVEHPIDRTKQFGNTAIKIYEAGPTQCLLLSEAREAQIQACAKVVSYCKELEKRLIEACDILVEEFGAIDSEATNLRERSSNLVAAEIAVDEKIGYIKGNLEQVRGFAQKQYDSAKENMRQCKDLSLEKTQEAAELLTKCDAAVESSSDANERLRVIGHQIQIISIFLTNNASVEATVHRAESVSGLAESLADAERSRFVELHKETSRSKEENAEYNELLERFSTEIIEHPERFITLAGGDAAQAGASPVNMESLTPDEHGDEEEDETTLKH